VLAKRLLVQSELRLLEASLCCRRKGKQEEGRSEEGRSGVPRHFGLDF
jgi:hypothetical protein